MGFLINPGDGPVPCVEFYSPPCPSGHCLPPTHMFTGSNDGSIAIWRAGREWEHLKLMKVGFSPLCAWACAPLRGHAAAHARWRIHAPTCEQQEQEDRGLLVPSLPPFVFEAGE